MQLEAGTPPALSTAVYALDAKYGVFLDEGDDPAAAQISRWAGNCRIEPGGGLYVLQCPEPPSARSPNKTPHSEATEVPATLALFRDLDETLYLAACPVLQPATPEKSERDGAPRKPDTEELRDCRAVSAGQTFTTEVDGETLKTVIRGRQLAFTVLEVRPKPRTTDTPYETEPSRRLPRVGPASKAQPPQGIEPQNPPAFEPPPLDEFSSGKPSEGSPADPPPARTSLRTGRFAIRCATSRARVYLDGVYLGACPLEIPIVAGSHSVTVKLSGKEDWVREFQIDAGETIRLEARSTGP
jgi:hypothetical protein